MWYSYLQYDVLASLLAHERSRFAICGKADIRNPLRYLLMNAVASRLRSKNQAGCKT